LCWSDNSYYDARYIVPPGGGPARLTVIDARSGAIVWRSPVTKPTACAVSHQRLMVAHVAGPGVVEYDIAQHQLVFDATHFGTVWRFAPRGAVAMCDPVGHIVGLGTNGLRAWHSSAACDAGEASMDFGSSTANLGVDLDIATGKLLGVVRRPPPPTSGLGYPSADRAVFQWDFIAPLTDKPCVSGYSVAFAGPYGVSPLLHEARAAGFDFSHRAIPIMVSDPANLCGRQVLAGWDQRGFFRWKLADRYIVAGFVQGRIGSDMATNGGDEASAIVGLGPSGGFELLDLP
jgi:hypothetical protein